MKNRKMYIGFIVAVMSFVAFSNFIFERDIVLAADQPIKLRVLSSWGPEYAFVPVWLDLYINKLNQKSGGRLQVSRVGPEAVPTYQQLKPLSAGLFDMLYSHPAYHMGEISSGTGGDTFKGTAKERRAFGFLELLNTEYKKVNAKVLGLSNGDVGFHFLLKKELQKADLTGLKIRSTPIYDPLVKALRGSSVVSAPADVYTILEKGIADGAVWPTIGALDYKWYEVTKFMTRPPFGNIVELVLINLDTWNKLPKDVQNIIEQITKETEEEGYKALSESNRLEEQKLISLGMKLNVLPPGEGEKFQNVFFETNVIHLSSVSLKRSPDFFPKIKALIDKFVSTHKQ